MKIIERSLKGGTKLILVDLPDSTSITAAIFVKVGSRIESNSESGISHLIEHCIFKGSRKFPTPQIISFSLEGLGASIDAGTSKEYTYYMVKSVRENFPAVLDILLDIYTNPLMEEDSVQREKGVVLEEIRMYRDDPTDEVSKLFTQTLWKNQSLGREISGNITTVKSLGAKDLMEFIRKNYTRKNTQIVISGNLDNLENVSRSIAQKLSDLSEEPIGSFTAAEESLLQDTVVYKKDKVEQTHLILGTYGVGLNNPGKFAAAVGNTILGQGMGSKLYRSIRHEHGLAYYINSGNLSYTDSGALYIRAGVDQKRIYRALESIVLEINSMMSGDFSDEELHRAKQMLKSALTLELDGSDSMGLYVGIQNLLVKEPMNIDEVKAAVDAVNKSDIVQIFRSIFSKPMLLSIISSKDIEETKLRDILSQIGDNQ